MLKIIKEKIEQRKIQKRRKKKYGKAKVKPKKQSSVYGKISCIFSIITAVLFIVLVAISYIQQGEAAVYIGVGGIMAMLLSVLGISAGFNGLRDKGKAHMSSRIGVGFNTAFLLIFAVLFLGGLF